MLTRWPYVQEWVVGTWELCSGDDTVVWNTDLLTPMDDAFWRVEQYGQNIGGPFWLSVLYLCSYAWHTVVAQLMFFVLNWRGRRSFSFRGSSGGRPVGKLPLFVTFLLSFLGCMRMDCHGSSLWLTGPGSLPLSPDPQSKRTPLRASATCPAVEPWSPRSQCFLIWNINQFSQLLLRAYCMLSSEIPAKNRT